MIKGMTGFGSAQYSNRQLKVTIELKSLNHRYFDISYYLPAGFTSMENRIRQILQKHLERGRVTVSVKLTQKSTQEIFLNKEAVHKYIKYANILSKEFGLKNDLNLSDLIKFPGVVESKETALDSEELWPMMEKYFLKALLSLLNMRKREGQSLAADVSQKLQQMLVQAKKIHKRHEEILKENRKRLTAEEFSSFQKSSDINEELSRLKHYMQELRLLLKSDSAVGKKIDFIAQEMQRETNTMGAKLLDKAVSSAVITLKSKIEKIREQSQNIE